MFTQGFRFAAYSSVVAALFFGALEARATTMVPFNEEDLSHIADVIVIGDVQTVTPEARFVPSGKGLGKQIFTKTSVKVVDSWKGPFVAGDLVTVSEIGGMVDKEMIVVPGGAGFLKNERVLLFLHYRTRTNDYDLVGWSQGKFTLLANANGGWDVSRIRIAPEKWGTPFVATEHENFAVRGSDLVTMATKVKRVVKADADANVNWRDMPQYRGISGKGVQR